MAKDFRATTRQVQVWFRNRRQKERLEGMGHTHGNPTGYQEDSDDEDVEVDE